MEELWQRMMAVTRSYGTGTMMANHAHHDYIDLDQNQSDNGQQNHLSFYRPAAAWPAHYSTGRYLKTALNRPYGCKIMTIMIIEDNLIEMMALN